MHVRFGEAVFGVAGKRIGDVDGLIVDAGTKRARALVVDAGLLDRAKHMVAVSSVARQDANGIYLDTTASKAKTESPVIESEEVAFPQRVEPPTTFIPAGGVGGPVIADYPAVPGEYPDDASFFDIAPIDPPPVEIESNLGENEVRLGRGADVYAKDDHKIGDLVSFDLGDMGQVDSIVVSEGFLLKTEATFPLAEIEEFGTNEVHLRLSREEAGKR